MNKHTSRSEISAYYHDSAHNPHGEIGRVKAVNSKQDIYNLEVPTEDEEAYRLVTPEEVRVLEDVYLNIQSINNASAKNRDLWQAAAQDFLRDLEANASAYSPVVIETAQRLLAESLPTVH